MFVHLHSVLAIIAAVCHNRQCSSIGIQYWLSLWQCTTTDNVRPFAFSIGYHCGSVPQQTMFVHWHSVLAIIVAVYHNRQCSSICIQYWLSLRQCATTDNVRPLAFSIGYHCGSVPQQTMFVHLHSVLAIIAAVCHNRQC